VTTLPPIDAGRFVSEPALPTPSVPLRGAAADDLPNQYAMARQQYVSFTQNEADQINQTLDLMEACTNKRVTPNKLIKQAAMQKSRQLLS
jgi:hypothetical protein